MADAKRRSRRALPGFGPTLGFTIVYLSLLVLLPLAALAAKAGEVGLSGIWAAATTPQAKAALRLSFGTALLAAAIDLVLGTIVAWSLVRYRFPGRRLLDAVIDLPFALPTAVSGLALAAVLGPGGWLGKPLRAIGIQGAFSRFGLMVALVFIGLPFVVRTLQPAIADLDPEVEEAAASLGAGRWEVMRRIIGPALLPAALTGFGMSFARALGEYGSVVFISGNLPFKTEIAPVVIVQKLENNEYGKAAAVALVMLAGSFLILLALNLVNRRLLARRGVAAT
jgi:sulfate transport system permease protein